MSPKWDRDQFIAAIQGKAIPDSLETVVSRCSVVRGIRRNLEYAQSPAVLELCETYPEFARARNARLIMSNEIPDNLHDHPPYCIWYPDFAHKETYRNLARRYPSMRYQVGRAAAAAGYLDLYKELDLLPDVSIAEEARESDTTGGREIYNLIMSAPVRYAVLDDFSRSVNTQSPPAPAFLNGDTAVRWTLERRETPGEYKSNGICEPDIEEDHRLNEIDIELPNFRENLTHEEASLLYKPLPLDLPTMRKELLIRMAAFEGNLDRYARLMRPRSMTWTEVICAARGIHHNTMFARWWNEQLETNLQRVRTTTDDAHKVFSRIKISINARRVMIGDVYQFDHNTKYMPSLIWWPRQPSESTLIALIRRCPQMNLWTAIAIIKCGYDTSWRIGLKDFKPHYLMKCAADDSPNPMYREDLERKASEMGIDLNSPDCDYIGDYRDYCVLETRLEVNETFIASPLQADDIFDDCNGYGTYFSEFPDPGKVENWVFQPSWLLEKLENTSDTPPYGYCEHTNLAAALESSSEEEDSDDDQDEVKDQEDLTERLSRL